jgi:antitoxin VapB
MRLSIKNDQAHRLATEPARLTGESLTTAVTLALRERLERVQRRAQRQGVAEALLELGRRYSALPERDSRTAGEILGDDGTTR